MIIPGFVYLFILLAETILYGLLVPLVVLSRPVIPSLSSGSPSGSSPPSGGSSTSAIAFPSVDLDVSGQLDGNPALFGIFTTIDPNTDTTDSGDDLTTESSVMPLKEPTPEEQGLSVADTMTPFKNTDGSSMSASEALASLTNPDGSIRIPEDVDSPTDAVLDVHGITKLASDAEKDVRKPNKLTEKLKNNPINKAIKKNQTKKELEANKKKDSNNNNTKKSLLDAIKEKLMKPLIKRTNDRRFERTKEVKRSFLNRRVHQKSPRYM